jgi:hypothetical protein
LQALINLALLDLSQTPQAHTLLDGVGIEQFGDRLDMGFELLALGWSHLCAPLDSRHL